MPATHTSHLHLLLPFALPSAAAAPATFHRLAHPAFTRLIARARQIERSVGDDFQRTLPHERWLTRRFGLSPAPDVPGAAHASEANDSAPLAPYMLLADGGIPGDALWACVQPVHVRIARDHLVLIDPASLDLSAAEATALLEVARPLVEALEVRLEAPLPQRWYLSSAALGALAGASPLRASGHNIEIWLPHETRSGERSRAWMKLQNEVQMAWFEHPVNEAREARGLPAVNSLWFHAPGALRPVSQPFHQVCSDAPATRGLALAAQAGLHPAPLSFDARPAAPASTGNSTSTRTRPTTLIELDPFSTAYLAQDWDAWNHACTALERDWFAPALAALHSGQLDELGLTLCSDTGSVTLAITRGDLRRFWRRRPLASLFIE